MKKNRFLLAWLISLVLISSNSYAQNRFSVQGGMSMPVSDFGSDDSLTSGAGGASNGFNLGGKFVSKLNVRGLSVYMAANLHYNPLKGSMKNNIKDMVNDTVVLNDIKFYKYLNIPIVAGLNYNLSVSDEISFYIEFGIGMDILKLTSMKVKINNVEAKYDLNPNIQMAYDIGAGLIIHDRYCIDIRYCDMGNHEVKGKITYKGIEDDIYPYKQKVAMVTVNLGYRF